MMNETMNDNDKKQLDQEAYLAAAVNYFCDAQRALGSAYQS